MKQQIEYISTEELIPYARNSRTHSDEQVAQISASIKEFGFTNPVLIDAEGVIIAGHGRTMAAQRLKMKEVPCLRLGYLTEAQKKAYVIADNKLALNAGWDDEMLALELGELKELDFDLSLTGFDDDELNALLVEAVEEGLVDEDEVPEAPEEPVSVLGDVWILDQHRVMCGDSTSIDAVDKLMEGQKADMVFTDPPYGINIIGGAKARNGSIGGAKARNGSICGANKVLAKEYRPIIGDDKEYDPDHIFISFPNCEYILWGANYYHDRLPIGGRWFVWDKNRGEGTTFSDCELAWSNIKGIVVKKYKVTWDGMNKEGESGNRVHPTQKPILLIEKILNDLTEKKIIVDLFGGSGSTLIACEKKGRKARLMELDPKYVDVIVKRWQDYTGRKAIHAESGKMFNETSNG